jgi:para-aminobenzoate synthetase component 1
MNITETIQTMNQLAEKGSPFFFMIDYAMNNCIVLLEDDVLKNDILFDFNGIRNFNPSKTLTKSYPLKPNPIPFHQYVKCYEEVQKQLNYGNSYLVNLTFPTPLQVSYSLDEIFHQSKAKYRLLYHDQFVVFSPESFVKIENQCISTYPMKGTIDASVTNALEKLLSNEKEIAEHATIVDLLRNDLSHVATNVRVEKYRYIDEIKSSGKTLLQVSSEIKGELPANYRSILGNIINEMLPAGSVTGAPKKRTVEIINNVEGYDRGFYTGISGFFDGENLDSCVLIRFIEKADNGHLVYKSGGGITAKSTLEEEYKELIDKIYVPIG